VSVDVAAPTEDMAMVALDTRPDPDRMPSFTSARPMVKDRRRLVLEGARLPDASHASEIRCYVDE
jgi:hypothetical protein